LAPEEEAEEPAVVSAEEEIPDWLADLAPVESEEEESAVVSAEEEIPDWLVGLAPEEAEEEPAVVSAEEEIPDWLVGLAPEEAEEEPAVISAEEEIPDRLVGLAPGEEAEEPAVVSSEEEMPDWLAAMVPTEEETVTTPQAEAEVPEWLAEMIAPEDQEARVSEIEGLTPAVESEVPDWLASAPAVDEEELPVTDEGLVSYEESGLAQAEIPTWLQAMRPEAEPTLAPTEEEREVETDGLLAGIAGVVRPASVITASAVSSAASEQMGVDATLARARLWQDLIARSTQPAKVALPQAPAKTSRGRIERWLVYAVVCAAVIIPILADVDLSAIFSFEQPLTAEAGVAYDFVNEKVAQDAPVLVVFDYDPAYVGELQAIAESIIHHLAQRQARIIFTSLKPEGAGLAQQVIDDVLSQHSYLAGKDYINLGYLPGEAVAVRSLEFLPTAFRDRAFDGNELEPGLVFGDSESFALSKMALVAVLTADAQNMRWWVEQTTSLEEELDKELPLVAGVSAAIEVLVRPYYDMSSRQIDGLVVGLPGAADYEDKLDWSDGPAHVRLGGLLVGQLAVAGLIVLGILVHGILGRGGGGA
jgi:hypothetical protein